MGTAVWIAVRYGSGQARRRISSARRCHPPPRLIHAVRAATAARDAQQQRAGGQAERILDLGAQTAHAALKAGAAGAEDEEEVVRAVRRH